MKKLISLVLISIIIVTTACNKNINGMKDENTVRNYREVSDQVESKKEEINSDPSNTLTEE